MYAIGSTELGGENTAEALHVALLMDLPLIDADPAGRQFLNCSILHTM